MLPEGTIQVIIAYERRASCGDLIPQDSQKPAKKGQVYFGRFYLGFCYIRRLNLSIKRLNAKAAAKEFTSFAAAFNV